MDRHQLKDLRGKLGLTQKAMAAKLGIGWRMYLYVESGTKHLSKASEMLATTLAAEQESKVTV